MWNYSQSSGVLTHNFIRVGMGYSGHGEGKNNPSLQNVPDVGPCPQGRYSIGAMHDTETHGPHVMALTPESGTNTFGRSGFLIHGDSLEHPGAASEGCIILPRPIRDQISASNDYELTVTA